MLSMLPFCPALAPALWAQAETKLTAGDGVVGEDFGRSVPVSGEPALAGSPRDGNESAYVFRRGDGAVQQRRMLLLK